jgi:hypothetical protein
MSQRRFKKKQDWWERKQKMQAFYSTVPKAEYGSKKFLHLESLYKLHELQFS